MLKQSTFTQLIIADTKTHTRTCHGGIQITLTFIRNSYWTVGSHLPVKSFILCCVICTRYRQKKAQLPSARVTPITRPFLHTGIDYAGPLFIKTWKGKNTRQYKAYIAVFICYSTSAVHLELITDYSADAFIAAYKRFTARRGICVTLSSDYSPGASHFKGKLEAAVKLVKFHLKRIVGAHLLTYKEMTMLLTQIEAVLNSRPLYP